MARDQQFRTYPNAAGIHDALGALRVRGRTLVTTNGCFDLLHAGHVQYLYEAAAMGDILVVGVNCDAVVRKHKGPKRPLQNEADRCMLVAALRMVDYAFIFHEDDPRAFLDILKPDIHVKGGDYDAESIIEKPVVERGGGVVRTVPFLQGRSTSQLVARCRDAGE
ncbi:MAG: adenylyltransferase/cytidyltransferase family protein [Chitinivibrionales bacterium]|nr:adenylyltransferase/cytidyltransferase family protein [Chitinivibrionales bacterium]